MTVVLAAVPIVVVIGLLLTRLPAWLPPVAGVATAVVIGMWVLDAHTAELTDAVGGSVTTMLQVLAIIGGGVTLARVMDRTGAQKQLADWLAAGGASLGSALMMANGVVPFMESVTGFGVSLIIGLPLTLAFGFHAYRAALITLMGIVIGPWGSMGPGTLLGTELAGEALTDMGLATAVVNFPAAIISGAVTAFIAAGHAKVRGAKFVGYLAAGAGSGLMLSILVLTSNLMLGTPVAGAVAAALMTLGWLLVIRKGKLRPVRRVGVRDDCRSACLIGVVAGVVGRDCRQSGGLCVCRCGGRAGPIPPTHARAGFGSLAPLVQHRGAHRTVYLVWGGHAGRSHCRNAGPVLGRAGQRLPLFDAGGRCAGRVYDGLRHRHECDVWANPGGRGRTIRRAPAVVHGHE